MIRAANFAFRHSAESQRRNLTYKYCMFKLAKKLLGRDLLMRQLDYSRELDWANIYRDSIKGISWLDKIPMNFGRWAGNYPFFYVLNRILSETRPRSILELGLGESSKFISAHLDNSLDETTHTIIEHDKSWSDTFKDRFSLCSRSVVKIHALTTKNVYGHDVNVYQNIPEYSQESYDLYIVDGPFGSPRYSRYDIVNLVENLSKNDDFIIMLDDVQKRGEQDTFESLLKIFQKKDIKVHSSIYRGTKQVAVIATDAYRFVTSL